MLFTTLPFLFRFLPLFLLLYYGVSAFLKGKAKVILRLVLLIIGSMIFYLGGFDLSSPLPLLLLLFSVIVNYGFSLLIQGCSVPRSAAQKACLTFGILFNVLYLCIFKYMPEILSFITGLSCVKGTAAEGFFQSAQPLFPLGISFYTFSALSYLIDVYRGEKAEKNPLYFAGFLLFFPKLLQGPISRYGQFRKDLQQMEEGVMPDFKAMEKGLALFILGLCFQGVLSSKMGALWTQVWSWGPYGIGPFAAWTGAWGYSMQLFFDFYGYSLMAQGLGALLGFTIPENFHSPYAATSAADFWRRWHATLGQWFRDYIYIPLGGSKNGVFRLILSTFVTWLVTGLWHGTGWNFLIWAGLFFILILLERAFLRKVFDAIPPLSRLYMLLLIPVSWMIFTIPDLPALSAYLKVMFFIPLEGSAAISLLSGFEVLLVSYWWLMLLCIVFASPYPRKFLDRYCHTWVCRVILLGLFWLAVWQITRSGSNPFMYLQF